jgi:sugar O-acyltransferase (sialic acid O-acetyltransferase NeuD family)
MKKLLLVGAGSGSREVLLMIDRINAREPEWEVVGFLDEDPEVIGTEVDGYPVIGPDHEHLGDDVYAVSGLMAPKVRQRLLEDVERRGYKLPTIIAPDVVLPRDFAAGPGTIIMPSVTVSFDVQLGKGVLVLWGCALGHHLRAGEWATVLSFATIAGGCKVGARTVIGARATFNVNVTVGSDALIGVGTTVLRDVKDGKRLVALPRQIESDLR